MKKFSSCNSIFAGEKGYEVMTIETDISSGIFFFRIIGLADRMVQESRFRILSALRNSEFGIPQRRNEKVTVSLLPAHVKKISSHSDLAIATAYLIASGQIPNLRKKTMLIGQLGLDGDLSCADNLSPMISIAIRNGIRDFICPNNPIDTVYSDEEVRIAHISNLRDMSKIQFKSVMLAMPKEGNGRGADAVSDAHRIFEIDSLVGIRHHKRALQIALAGKHPILFGGVPGSGKSALAKCAEELMTDLSPDKAIEVQSTYAHAQIPRPDFHRPPVRTPHHHMTRIGMIGGTQNRHIGEISLAHHGILILDELCEFDRGTIESLREVFDQRGAHLRKGSRQSFMPFEGLVIATTNLCPCGSSAPKSMRNCRCGQARIRQYQSRLSNPMLDRFHIKTIFSLNSDQENRTESAVSAIPDISGSAIAKSICDAERIQNHRNGPPGAISNAYLTAHEIIMFGISTDASMTLSDIEKELSLPKRLVTNTLRIARTIADIESSQAIQKPHVLEAFQYVKTNPFE